MFVLLALLLAIVHVWRVYLLVVPAQLPHFVLLARMELLFMLPTAPVSQLALQAIITTLMAIVLFVLRLALHAQQLHFVLVAP